LIPGAGIASLPLQSLTSLFSWWPGALASRLLSPTSAEPPSSISLQAVGKGPRVPGLRRSGAQSGMRRAACIFSPSPSRVPLPELGAREAGPPSAVTLANAAAAFPSRLIPRGQSCAVGEGDQPQNWVVCGARGFNGAAILQNTTWSLSCSAPASKPCRSCRRANPSPCFGSRAAE